MNTLSLLVSPVGLAALPTVTKSVGSIFRYNVDYRNAPEEDRRNEYKREISLLSLAFISNLGVQLLAARHLPKILKTTVPSLVKDPARMQAASLLARFALTIPGTVIAETLSRVIGKPPSWEHAKKDDDAGETRFSQPPQTASATRQDEVVDDDRYERDDDDDWYGQKPATAPVFSQSPAAPVFNPFVTGNVPMAGTFPVPLMYHDSGQSAQPSFQPVFANTPPAAFAPRNF